MNFKDIYISLYGRGPYFERLIRKSGAANVNRVNIENFHRKYILDLFNTIVDSKWRFILFIFVMSFLVSWTLFAMCWFILIRFSTEKCIENVSNNSFFEALFFSIETQQTIGYGFRYISKNCNEAIFILMLQCGFSVVLESFMGGIVFAKLSRPKKRTETLIFSKRAVIAKRDGYYCLMCRVGDMRKSHIIQTSVRMYLIKTRHTKEGEIIPWNAQELLLSNNINSLDRLIFMPIIVEHKIDETSPLRELITEIKRSSSMSKASLNHSFNVDAKSGCKFKHECFEIVLILEGTLESTGASMQARTSYLPTEILWDHVFEPLIDTNLSTKSSKATIDFSKFDMTKKQDKGMSSTTRPSVASLPSYTGRINGRLNESKVIFSRKNSQTFSEYSYLQEHQNEMSKCQKRMWISLKQKLVRFLRRKRQFNINKRDKEKEAVELVKYFNKALV
jgi:potassium inwardly-rectifying channel subfamily J, other